MKDRRAEEANVHPTRGRWADRRGRADEAVTREAASMRSVGLHTGQVVHALPVLEAILAAV